jgi:predicted nucleic acid-binding protein
VTDAILVTNIIVDILNGFQPALLWFADIAEQHLAITSIVWMETVEGARNLPEQKKIIDLLTGFKIEHSTQTDDEWAMEQFAKFHLSHGLEFQDAMIASVSIRLSVPPYTQNMKHFAPLPGVDERKPY